MKKPNGPRRYVATEAASKVCKAMNLVRAVRWSGLDWPCQVQFIKEARGLTDMVPIISLRGWVDNADRSHREPQYMEISTNEPPPNTQAVAKVELGCWLVVPWARRHDYPQRKATYAVMTDRKFLKSFRLEERKPKKLKTQYPLVSMSRKQR